MTSPSRSSGRKNPQPVERTTQDGGAQVTHDTFRSLRHDLRTPLNHIIGYAELLLEEAEATGCSDFAPDLQKIRLAGRELLAVVNRYLDPARSETSDLAPQQLSHELRTPLNAIIGYAELPREQAE